MRVLAYCLLVISAVTETDARHGCTTCPSNACSQNEAHIGFCNDELYVSEGYQCSYTTSRQTSRRTYYGCGWLNSDRCSRDVTYYESVTRYRTCYRSRLNCQRRCCSGFQSSGGNCLVGCSDCHNGGVCIDPEVCECPSNWKGQYCNVDVNECEMNNGGCSDYCNNNPGSYSCACRQYADLDPDGRHCTCRPGFIQNDDTVTCDDIDECAADSGGCHHNCTNTPGSHICQCDPGYELHVDLKMCLPICTGGCLNGGECVAPETCNCSTGWTGQNCESDIDECAVDNGGCDHDCTNTPGSHICQCDPGYQLQIDTGMCLAICTGGCLNGECILPEVCECAIGWTGTRCETDIEECIEGSSDCEQNCTNTLPGYTCSCDTGYNLSENGHTCDDLQPHPEALGLGTSGVAAVSGVAVSVIITGLVLCVVVLVIMKLRGLFCGKATKDTTQVTEPTPEDYGGFVLTPNPAYDTVEFAVVKSDRSQDEEVQPTNDDGNVYVSPGGEPPVYENLKVLY